MIIDILHPTQLKVRNIKLIAQVEIAVGLVFQALADFLSVCLGEENQHTV